METIEPKEYNHCRYSTNNLVHLERSIDGDIVIIFQDRSFSVDVGKLQQALASLQASPKTFDFAIAHGYLSDDCCGILYWSKDGKILCNECGMEFDLREQAEPGEFTKRLRKASKLHQQSYDFGKQIDVVIDEKLIDEACDLIDRQQAERAAKDKALEYILEYWNIF